VDPVEISNIDSPEEAHDTLGPSKTKTIEEAQDISITLVKTASLSPEQGGDGEEIGGT
jgi:hypothetical protein